MKTLAKLALIAVILFSATAQAFAQQPPCSNLIVNGSFEEEGGWRWELTPKPASFTQDTAWDGSRSMLLGNLDPSTDALAFSSVWQDITVPPDVYSVNLSFRYKLVSKGPQNFDEAKFVLLSPTGDSILAVPWRERQDTAGEWKEVSIDLTNLTKGKTVRFYFGVVNDGNGNPTAMYLDDVRLMVCTAYALPPTPAPVPVEVIPTPTLEDTLTFTPQPLPTPPVTPLSPLGITPTPSPTKPLPPITYLSIAVVASGVILIILLVFILLPVLKGRRRAGSEEKPSQEAQTPSPEDQVEKEE